MNDKPPLSHTIGEPELPEAGRRLSPLERRIRRWERDMAEVEERLKNARASERQRLLRLHHRLKHLRPPG